MPTFYQKLFYVCCDCGNIFQTPDEPKDRQDVKDEDP